VTEMIWGLFLGGRLALYFHNYEHIMCGQPVKQLGRMLTLWLTLLLGINLG